ncbi:glycosyltransferase family 2 protein [soil metagenome]
MQGPTLLLTLLSIGLTIVLVPSFLLMLLVTASAFLPGLGRRRGSSATADVEIEPPRFLFLIPAHDEEEGIGKTVESCRAVAYDPQRFAVWVIADNCSDATARVARDAGAEVLERSDPSKKSKGYALEYAFAQLPINQYNAVVIVDADSLVSAELLDAFAEGLAKGNDWLQCYDTVQNADASWRTRLMTYAFSLINGVWLLGQDRLGLGAALRGNGMCLSTRGLARFPWRVYGLTEDVEFSWALRTAGERVGFVPRGQVLAEMLTRGGPAAAAQRQRWEAGRKQLRGLVLGPLLRSRKIGPFRKLAYLVELLSPTLVGLTLLLLISASVHVWAEFDPQSLLLSKGLLPVHGLLTATLAAYALSPFLLMGLPARYALSLLALPYYAAWKLAKTLGRRPTAWVRTRRETVAQRQEEGEGEGPALAESIPTRR